MITFSNPWIGVVIPCIIIFTLSTFSAIFILPHHVSKNELTLFIGASAMVWISYIIAIIVPPGSPPKNYTPPENGMKMYCLKCKAYKPERTHHSKALGVCVLKMDHHCPWTNNTVGHRNMPHFMRFLAWVDMTVGYLFIRLCIRVLQLWRDRHLPSYLFDKTEVILSIVFLPGSFFVLFTVGILTIRVFVNMCNGITQIESWECDRVESLVRRKIVTEDRAEFPYDIELFTNIFNAVGGPLTFWLPWGPPRGDGITFEKNESGYTEEGEPLCWPPDHVDYDPENVPLQNLKDGLRRRGEEPDCLLGGVGVGAGKMKAENDFYKRDHWRNVEGEKLTDFGVEYTDI